MNNEYRVVFVTVPNEDAALAVASAVLEKKLAACVNIVPAVRSLYWWEGRICDDCELLCIIKTKSAQFDALAEAVRSVHPYKVPEIISLPISAGSSDYLKWIDENITEK